MSTLVNYVVASTSLYVLLPLYYCTDIYARIFMINSFIASVCLHLGEINFGLVGIRPFNKYSSALWVYDRIASTILIIYLYQISSNFSILFNTPWPYLALIAGLLTDTNLSKNHYFFMIIHGLSHVFALHSVYILL